jgi:hypothetical protein
LDADLPTIEEWKIRRTRQIERADTLRPRRYREAADLYALEPAAQPLQAHKGLTKAKSSLLTQARTGAIGLKDFLFKRGVPGVLTPLCRCGRAPETVAHLVLKCQDQEIKDGRPQLRDRHALMEALGNRSSAARIITWLMNLGRLAEYRLALELEREGVEEDLEEGEGTGNLGSAKKKKRKKIYTGL